MSYRYDACVIGSGIGGLTCGAFLARAGMRVLVLEKHSRIGGYADSFKRRNYIFESSVHSVPLASQGMIMYLLGLLGIDSLIQPVELPEMFSTITPECRHVLPSRKEEILDYLYRSFPHQKENIDQFITEMTVFADHIIKPIYGFEESFCTEDTQFVSLFHNKSYQHFIEKMFTDAKLRLLFEGQWPYVGASPDYAPNLFSFMMLLVHFFEGSHTCIDGFTTIAQALGSVITRAGGTIQTRSEVTELIVEKKAVRKIITAQHQVYEADIVVSNISPYIVHHKLLPQPYQSKMWKRRLANLSPSVSSVIIYLGMKPEIVPILPQTITFWYESSDFKRIFSNILQNRKDSIDHLIFLRSSLTNEFPTLTLMNFVQKSFSCQWKRDKVHIADKMIDKAECLFPGLRACIETIDIGSPETFERYTANTDGALYGFENSKNVYKEAKMPMRTHLDNLFQTGHWGKPGCGIWNVMTNGYTCSKVILQK